MKQPSKLLGLIFVVLGFVFNENFLIYLFSSDGLIMTSTRILIWSLDVILVVFGIVYIFSKFIRHAVYKLFHLFIFGYIDLIKFFVYCSKTIIDRSLIFIFSVILLFQLNYLIVGIYKNSDSVGVVSSQDLDAGRSIKTSLESSWYNFHDTFGYGVLYFRIANSIQGFIPNKYPASDDPNEKNEQRIHFSLCLISLLSLAGISTAVTSLIIKKLPFRLLSIIIINGTFFSNSMWVNYIFRVHPDILLSFLTCLLVVVSKRISGSKVEIPGFYALAFLSAAALSTKQSFLYFLPGLIFIRIPPFNKDRILQILHLFFLITIMYWIIGFPQNFRIDQNLSFLLNQSRYSLFPTFASVTEWITLLLDQSFLPIVVITVLSTVLGEEAKSENTDEKKSLGRTWILVSIPILFLLSRKIISAHAHYTLPNASMILAAYALSIRSTRLSWILKLKKRFERNSIRNVFALLLLFVFHLTIGITPPNVDTVLGNVMGDRLDARQTYSIEKEHADSGKKILVEGYTPFDHSHPNIRYYGLLSISLARFQEFNPDVVVLNAGQLPRIMEGEKPSDYMIQDRENYRNLRDFYSIFYKKTYATDSLGQEWRITYTDANQVQIWVKSNSAYDS